MYYNCTKFCIVKFELQIGSIQVENMDLKSKHSHAEQ